MFRRSATLRARPQFHDHCAPASELLARLGESDDVRMPSQDGFDTAAQIPNTFPMDNADFVNPFVQAGFDVIRKQGAEVLRAKRVQIQFSGNGHFDGSIRQFGIVAHIP